jgi:PAS domain-containing protein
MTPITADELASLLGLSPACLLLLDRAGRVLHGNAAAERLFAQQAVLCLRDSTLHARRKDEDKFVQDAMAKLSVADPTGSLCLRSREGFPVVLLDLHRLGNGRVVARLTDLTARPIPSTDRMRSVLGLTRAEAVQVQQNSTVSRRKPSEARPSGSEPKPEHGHRTSSWASCRRLASRRRLRRRANQRARFSQIMRMPDAEATTGAC